MKKSAQEKLLAELCELAKKAYYGDVAAGDELRKIGEILALAGGFEAMSSLQGQVHDFEIDNRTVLYSLAGTIGSFWDHIDVWANA